MSTDETGLGIPSSALEHHPSVPGLNLRNLLLAATVAFVASSTMPLTAQEQPPNILVIWGDDIGITNLSCYSDGLMGYRTPNIDRIAAEGMRFKEFPPRQKAASFTIDLAVAKLEASLTSGR